MNTNAKIFVTGHRGMVGSAIVRRLQSGSYTNLLTGRNRGASGRLQRPHRLRQQQARRHSQGLCCLPREPMKGTTCD